MKPTRGLLALCLLAVLLAAPLAAQPTVQGTAQANTCSGTDKFSAFNVATGVFTCSADAGGGIGGTLGTADNVVPRSDGTGGATAQDSAIKIEDYVSTSPASDYVSITPFGADSIISTRLNYVGGNGSPGVYGAGILINSTSVGVQASGSYFKTWDGGGGNAPILIGLSASFGGTSSASPMLRATGTDFEAVLADSSNFTHFTARNLTAKGKLIEAVYTFPAIADDGAGTKPSSTLTPTSTYVTCSCADTNPGGCTVPLSETGAVDGQLLNLISIGAQPCDLADTAGVSELPAGGISLGTTDAATLIYSAAASAWIYLSGSNN